MALEKIFNYCALGFHYIVPYRKTPEACILRAAMEVYGVFSDASLEALNNPVNFIRELQRISKFPTDQPTMIHTSKVPTDATAKKACARRAAIYAARGCARMLENIKITFGDHLAFTDPHAPPLRLRGLKIEP